MTVADLLIYVYRAEEIIAVFPVGTMSSVIREIVQAEKMRSPTEFLYGSVKSEIDAVKAIRRFRESGRR